MTNSADDTIPFGNWLSVEFYKYDPFVLTRHGVLNPSAIWLCREATDSERGNQRRPAVYVELISGSTHVMTGDAADALMKYFKIKGA